MISIVQNFEKIKSIINDDNVKIIAVSKTFSYEYIKPLVDYGHVHFGENKIQEAQIKWTEIKKKQPSIKLHMIGKLQSNKAKDAVNLFDYIHSVDNLKLAKLLAQYQNDINKKLSYFIQVNIGHELQKSGIVPDGLEDFFHHCTKNLKLNIIGLMAIPPNDNKESFYFQNLMELNQSLHLKDLSMGMSGDFQEAIKYKSTFVRIGSSIFGNRD